MKKKHFLTGMCACSLFISGAFLGSLSRSGEVQQPPAPIIKTFIKIDGHEPIAVQTESQVLAFKNRNPLNVKTPSSGKWKGQVGTDKHGHAIFSSWEHGTRAASFTLRSYAIRHKIDTIDGLVERFCEGNKREYKKFLSKRLGVGVNEKISLLQYLPQLLKAMSKFETGAVLPDELFTPYDVVSTL